MFPGRLDRLHRKAMILLRNASKYVIKFNGALFDFGFVNFHSLYSQFIVQCTHCEKKTEVRKTAKQLGHSRFTNFEILCFNLLKED